MSSIKTLAQALNTQAKALRVTRRTLKEDAGIATQTVVNILSGKEDYRMSSFLAVADRLGLEVVLMPKGMAEPMSAQSSGVKTAVQRLLESHIPNAQSDRKEGR